MAKWWSGLVDAVTNQLVVEDVATTASHVPALKDAVERARRDWLQARLYFDNVTDPDLVDHAIFCIEAAEKKYMYLLKQARVQGIRISVDDMDKQILVEVPHMHHQST